LNKLLTTIALLCFSAAAKGQLEDTYLCIGEVSAAIYRSESSAPLRSNSIIIGKRRKKALNYETQQKH
jgi:hypothetical protein